MNPSGEAHSLPSLWTKLPRSTYGRYSSCSSSASSSQLIVSQPVPYNDPSNTKEFEPAICSIRSVHVFCDAGGGGSMVVGFSVEKERPNKIPNLVQNDTFRETRISCRQRSSASFSFPPTQIHSSDNDPRQEIMHCLNSRSFVEDQVENRTVTFAIYEDSEIRGGNLLCPSEQVVE